MKKILVLAALMALCASSALAATHPAGGLGFHHMSAPIGLRWWMGPEQQMAIDLGVGIDARDAGDETLTDFTVEAGLPIVIKSWDRAHFMFRPGVLFESYATIIAGDTERGSVFDITAELEAEVFLVDNVSVSASHGFGASINSPPGEDVDSSTNFGTFGNDFTNIGFHVYFLGE